MKKIEGVIFKGEKIGFEKTKTRDNKINVNLHMLKGFESLRIGVKDVELIQKLEAVPDRDPIVLVANVICFKDEIYLTAIDLV